MIVSFHITHSSIGADCIADVIPVLDDKIESFIKCLSPVTEYVILRTCNRFEVYMSTTDDDEVKKAFEQYATNSIPYSRDDGAWYLLSDELSVKHLFRVTCGLDSLVLGENQIQGQVKEAYSKAKSDGHVKKILSKLFERALYIGKRVRSETELNSGAISVGSAAVELAKKKLGDLKGKTVAIVGAGDMAAVIAKYMVGMEPNAIFISSRTFEHAKILANQLNGIAVGYERMVEVIGKSDLVIVATGAPHIILNRKAVEDAVRERTKKLLIIDISVPRNVSDDVSEIENVDIETMKGIGFISSENLLRRRNEIIGAEEIVNYELKKIGDEQKMRIAEEIIGKISRKASEIRAEELSIALSRISGGSDPENVLNDFSRALMSKLLSEPYEKLKVASVDGHTEMCKAAVELFGVENK